MPQNKKPMTISKRKPLLPSAKKPEQVDEAEAIISSAGAAEETKTVPPTGKIFLGEEDKRLLQKLNKHLVNKLGLGGSRSFKV